MKNINKLFSVLLVFVLGMFLASTINLEAAAQGEFLETFENAELPGSYSDGSFVGENSTTFNYGHSRDEDTYAIDGKGIMLRRASDSYIEFTIVGGLSELSFDYRKAYTGSSVRQLEIIINGNQVATTDTFGGTSSADSTVYVFNRTDLDYQGQVTIRIKNVGSTTSNRQIVIDNIKWTSNLVELIESVDGASIRTDGVQGLRFYAKVTDNYDNEAKGFYLMFGEATIADLEFAIGNNMVDSKGKTVVDVPVGGVTVDGEFSVVLTGIPDNGYFDHITVIPYVLVEGTNVFVNPVTRSVGEVAIKMAEDGHALPEGMEDKLNNFTKVLNIENNVLEFSKGLKDSEDNYVNLELYDVYHPETTEEITLPIPEERLGYTFNGWYDDPLFAGDVLTAVSIDFVGTLYAKWEETDEVEETVATIKAEGTRINTDINAGDITSYFTITNSGSATLQVNLTHGSASTKSIFNNSAGETRLYKGLTLEINVPEAYVITNIKITTSQNDGAVINGTKVTGSNMDIAVTELSAVTIFCDNGQVRISNIEITYRLK